MLVPVKAKLGNGQVVLSLRPVQPDRRPIGDPSSVTVDVHADWEGIGALIFGILLVLLFGFGIVRNILRRRSKSGDGNGDEADARRRRDDRRTNRPDAADRAPDADTPTGASTDVASVGRASAMLASGTLVSRLLGFAKAWLLLQAIGAVAFAANAVRHVDHRPEQHLRAHRAGHPERHPGAADRPRVGRTPTAARPTSTSWSRSGSWSSRASRWSRRFLAPVLMQLFGVRGAQRELATAFAYWSLPQIFFLGLYTLLGEVLNARKSFGPFTWAPVVNNIVAHRDAGRLHRGLRRRPRRPRGTPTGRPAMIALLAGGATLGIAVQALILFFFWRRVGLRFRFDFGWRGVNLGHAGRRPAGPSACSSPPRSPGLIETNVANSAGTGLRRPVAMHEPPG